ncbi:MAG: BtaA family protein [Verrucomicrobiales bacterium]|nr:BtaA family protein [Verrucomicrobiales bacterium]
MKSEIQQHADFSKVRYANCWEDADILIEALIPLGRHCVSIGSAGDNSFSLLAEGAKTVTIVEMNQAQIACIKLRMAAYQCLKYKEFLTLLGELQGDRYSLYKKCRSSLDSTSRAYWDHFSDQIVVGFGRIGKFESYFDLFRDKLMPWVHSRSNIEKLLAPKTDEERVRFYQQTWNNWRWRLLFKVFFSRFVMGRLGRDPAFFKYVEGSVADKILERTRHALIELQPSQNPYLRWILNGHYGKALPHALRAKNFTHIGDNLDKITIDARPLEEVLENSKQQYDAFNLSDIFEYMSEENTKLLLRRIHANSATGARLAYWNMLVPRARPESLAAMLKPLPQLSKKLFLQDKAFFYSAFIVEEVI